MNNCKICGNKLTPKGKCVDSDCTPYIGSESGTYLTPEEM